MDDSTHARRLGWWPRAKAAMFGMPDPVQSELKELSEQGAGLARFAHFCAFLMLILFSLGSLVGVAGASTTAVFDAWQAGRLDLIHAISTSVSTALVLCMDAAALYAAAMLRILSARRAGVREQWTHYAIIAVADIIEAASYVYMSWLYDLPTSPLIWGLIIGRAIAAPIFAVYLSLARPLPVGPRDMLYLVEMAAGVGLIKDVTLIASDAAAPVARKAEIYGAASPMAPDDRSRLDGVIKVLQAQPSAAPVGLDPMLDAFLSGAARLQPPLETPPDGGSPVAARPGRRQRLDPASIVGMHLLAAPEADAEDRPRGSRAKATSKPRKATAKAKRVRDTRTDEEIKEAIRTFVAPALAAGRKLPSNTAVARGVGVSSSTASKHLNIILAERAAQVLPLVAR